MIQFMLNTLNLFSMLNIYALYIVCHHLAAVAGFQVRSKDQEILEEGGGAGPST